MTSRVSGSRLLRIRHLTDRIEKYLRGRTAPVSSQELVENVLRIQNADPELADCLARSAVRDVKNVYRTEDGLWAVKRRPERETLAESDFLLCLFTPERVASWHAWRSMGWLVVRGFVEIERRNAHGSGAIGSALKRLATAFDDKIPVFNGFGNQVSVLRQAMMSLCGLDPDITPLRLSTLARRLFPGSVAHDSQALADLFGLEGYISHDIDVQLNAFADQFFACLHLLSERGIDSLPDLHSFYEGERIAVDFDRYAFDENFLSTLPASPGVYVMKDRDGRIVYVGKAKDLARRVASYFVESFEIDEKLARVREALWDIDIRLCGSECEALLLEYELIQRHRPPINSQVNIRDRAAREYVKYSRIVILPAARNEKVQLYLLEPQYGLSAVSLCRDFCDLDTTQKAIEKVYFTRIEGDRAPARADQMEIVASWLALNEDRVHSIDMRTITSAEEAVRLVKAHVRGLGDDPQKTVYY